MIFARVQLILCKQDI